MTKYEIEQKTEEDLNEHLADEIWHKCNKMGICASSLVEAYRLAGVRNVISLLKELQHEEARFREDMRTASERRLLEIKASKAALECYEQEENLRNGTGC